MTKNDKSVDDLVAEIERLRGALEEATKAREVVKDILIEAACNGEDGISESGGPEDYRGWFTIRLYAREMTELMEAAGIKIPHGSWPMQELERAVDATALSTEPARRG